MKKLLGIAAVLLVFAAIRASASDPMLDADRALHAAARSTAAGLAKNAQAKATAWPGSRSISAGAATRSRAASSRTTKA